LRKGLKSWGRNLERRVGEVESNLTVRIELLEKRVEVLEADMKQVRASIDSLRDLIINKLVEALAKKP
jgi:Prefoldin subunit.